MSVDEARLRRDEEIARAATGLKPGEFRVDGMPDPILDTLELIAEIRRHLCRACQEAGNTIHDLKTANAALDAENADLRRRYEECRARGLAEAIRRELSGVVAERSELMGLLIKAEAENAELRKERDEHLNASLRYYAQIGDMENEAEAENVKLCKVANENADLRQRLAELTKQIQGLGGTPETCRED